eukprot:g73829.t1
MPISTRVIFFPQFFLVSPLFPGFLCCAVVGLVGVHLTLLLTLAVPPHALGNLCHVRSWLQLPRWSDRTRAGYATQYGRTP